MILAALVCLLFSSSVFAAQAEVPPGESVVYKRVDGRELTLWIAKPRDWKQSDRRPAIVLFHGGAFIGGAPTQFAKQSEYLASRGMVCINVQYRLLDKDGKDMPVICCQDAKSAMRYVRSHADELGIDPDRIAAGGGSAGGYLAAFVSMVEGMDDPSDDRSISPRGNALVLFNPVLDTSPQALKMPRFNERFEEFSPSQHVRPGAPPTIIFLGTKDNLVPVPVNERFKEKMQKAGVRCDAVYYEGEGHGFFNREPFLTRTLIEADTFLASLGWLKGPPTISSRQQ